MSIYLEAQAIAASGKKVLVMVSRGRDSLCMAHALLRHVPRDRLVFLHLLTYPDLRYQLGHLERIESALGIKIEIQPSRQRTKIETGKLPDFSKERNGWRERYECDLVAYGFRSDESVSRSVIMRQWPDGINAKSFECYPLKRWNRSLVAAYTAKHRLPMAVEYESGFRDCGEQFTGRSAVWLHDTFPGDFERAAAFDRYLQAEYVRAVGAPV